MLAASFLWISAPLLCLYSVGPWSGSSGCPGPPESHGNGATAVFLCKTCRPLKLHKYFLFRFSPLNQNPFLSQNPTHSMMITSLWLRSILPYDSASSPFLLPSQAVNVYAALQAFLLWIRMPLECLAWERAPLSVKHRDLQDSLWIYYKPLFIFKYCL